MLKILLTNLQTGVLIGQGGNTVSELQRKTGARVKVSNKTMTFPSTQLRIIAVEGSDEQLFETIKAIVDLCFAEIKDDSDPESEFILALPSAAAPVIIGKQGSKVTDIMKQTSCDVRFDKQSDEIPGVRERVATLKGKKAGVIAAIMAMLDLMFKDPLGKATIYDNRSTNYDVRERRRDYREDRHDARGGYRDDYRRERDSRDHYDRGRDSRYDRDSRDYRGRDSQREPRSPRRSSERSRSDVAPLVVKPGYSTQVSVPDEFVGTMLGRNGENIAEIERSTHTRIKVSPRGEYVPDTRDRIVTISGNVQDCENAKTMLAEKITRRS
jgi:RNA-binding protein Nova